MTVCKQDNGYITFLCDGSNGCTSELETDFKQFDLAVALMRDEGWIFRREGNAGAPVFKHYCEDCKDEH